MNCPINRPINNSRPTQVVIDKSALAHNLQQLRKLVPTTKVMAVIKADGYGHGMELVADVLCDADEFAVNGFDDVWRLRRYGIEKPITMLSANFTKDNVTQLVELNVHPTIFDATQISCFETLSDDSNLSVWIKVDTGMGRLGFLPEELPITLKRLSKIKGITNISLMTHLANADNAGHPSNNQQIALFTQMSALYDFSQLSILNSAGIINYANAARDIVRPGILLYGISPNNDNASIRLGLKPAMTFKSKLISVKRLPSGSSVGYGSRYVLDHDTRVGVVACGYGDGYPRHAPSGTSVLVNDMLVPLIGRVSMDMISVDLGDIPADVGDEVILWGENNPIEGVAYSAGTIGYELACGILPRVERVVI